MYATMKFSVSLYYSKDGDSAYCGENESIELTILIKGNPLPMAMVAPSAVFPLHMIQQG